MHADLTSAKVGGAVIGKAGLNVGPDRPTQGQDTYFIKYIVKNEVNQTNPKPNQIPSFFFFLEQDLQKGNTMTLSFPRITNMATLLPREVAESIPFSPDKIPDIFKRFGIMPNSVEAKEMNKTMRACNWPEIKVEKKTCATSLESMADFVKSQIGNNVKAVSTEMYGQNRIQKYSINTEAVRALTKDEKERVMSCHKKNYVYAVYYCHMLERTMAYKVPLVGEDGTKIDAVAICHRETSEMSPGFWAFRVLGLEPGTLPICHFLPQDHVLFYD